MTSRANEKLLCAVGGVVLHTVRIVNKSLGRHAVLALLTASKIIVAETLAHDPPP